MSIVPATSEVYVEGSKFGVSPGRKHEALYEKQSKKDCGAWLR
jgi:hypothetical protein